MWIYLFFLPFQLVDLFGWYAIPGVAIAAFIYLGMIAAGEEIEQPFGAYLPSPLESTDADTVFSKPPGYDEVHLYYRIERRAESEY